MTAPLPISTPHAAHAPARVQRILVDIVGFAVAGLIATLTLALYSGNEELFTADYWLSVRGLERLMVVFMITAVGVAWMGYQGHYGRRRPFWDEIRDLVHALLIVAILDATLLYLLKLDFSRVWYLTMWAMVFVLVPTFRVLWRKERMRAGRWNIPTVVIGTGETACESAAALASEPWMGMHVVAMLEFSVDGAGLPATINVTGREIPVYPLRDDILDQLKAMGRPHVVVALENAALCAAEPILGQLHQHFTEVTIVPAITGIPLYGTEVNHFFRSERIFLRVRNNLARPTARQMKRVFDITVSSLLLAVLSPLFAYLMARISLSHGPIFFAQERIGRYGAPFKCWKFRTMVPNADQVLTELLASDPVAAKEWAQDFKLKNDPRVTQIGRFLRATSLDELPQLWNVLKGEMSLVGPRPIIEAEIPRYGSDIGYYLAARPGMSGVWQISGRSDTDYGQRVYLDAWYSKNWSLWYDIVILIKTVNVVFSKSGAY